jgi:Asp-tRNA(Asn)/Glu-tRNA(Gln) amidotransferase A subunit family amidase
MVRARGGRGSQCVGLRRLACQRPSARRPARNRRSARRAHLQALVAPTGAPAWPTDLVNGDHFLGASSAPAAITGYPIVNVPAGDSFGLPVGISFIGTAWSEPTLIELASGFEAAAKARKKPQFLATLPLDGANQLRRRKRPKKKEAPAGPAIAGL